MNDKTFFAKLRQASTVVPGMVRKFAKFLVIAGPTVGACLLMLAGTLLVGGHTHKDYIAGPALAGLGIAVVSLFLAAYIMLLGYVYGDVAPSEFSKGHLEEKPGSPHGIGDILVTAIGRNSTVFRVRVGMNLDD